MAVLASFGAWGVLHAQRPFREYQGREYKISRKPDDYPRHQTEWTRARLRYPALGTLHNWYDFTGIRRRRPLNWTIDYPRSDRHLLQGIRRLTRIDTRSVEQVVDLDGDRRRLQLAR